MCIRDRLQTIRHHNLPIRIFVINNEGYHSIRQTQTAYFGGHLVGCLLYTSWHIMKLYSHYGYNEFVICCGYKQHMIKEWFADYYLHLSLIHI